MRTCMPFSMPHHVPVAEPTGAYNDRATGVKLLDSDAKL